MAVVAIYQPHSQQGVHQNILLYKRYYNIINCSNGSSDDGGSTYVHERKKYNNMKKKKKHKILRDIYTADEFELG